MSDLDLSNPYEAAAARELERWPGVSVRLEHGGKHHRIVLFYNGRSRFVVYPATGSDRRGPLNHQRDIREALTRLGAERLPCVKLATLNPKPRLKPRLVDVPIRLKAEPLRKDPTRDPFAVLATLDLAPPMKPGAVVYVEPPRVPRMGFISRLVRLAFGPT